MTTLGVIGVVWLGMAVAVVVTLVLALRRERKIEEGARRLEEMRRKYAGRESVRLAMGDELGSGDVALLWALSDAKEAA